MIDATHDTARTSWVTSANGHCDFPIQNLPFGVFSPKGGAPRGGVAIGDQIFDLAAAVELGLFDGPTKEAAEAAAAPSLNAFFGLGAGARTALRARLVELLDANGVERSAAEAQAERILHPAATNTAHLPAAIGDYTDFYAGISHATNVGKLFRPDNPLLPNYKYVPIGYHGRGSSIGVSAGAVRRPNGQRKRPDEAEPSFGPCRNLDYELELGVFVGAGNALGEPIPIGAAGSHIAGFCLLNDWSARDIQSWEYQPLGPFLAKNFATTLSPWVITPEALAPFRIAQPVRPEGDPAPLPYLFDPQDQAAGALDLDLEVLIETEAMAAKGLPPHRLSRGSTRDLYWTFAQLLAHHASGGCNLAPGDLLGTGTISGTSPDSYGSLLELTRGGKAPIMLPSGEERRFLEDGDTVIIHGRAVRDGFVSIGFGECRGTILPAPVV
ncbi:fumarylacetoacetase [Xanthobacter sp. DSM 24535]|uniref:fumarylacetoacetase n=1 Tax=Roseixanthobacter psychrophilus TaxID=3119917 RepID=UPI003727DC34